MPAARKREGQRGKRCRALLGALEPPRQAAAKAATASGPLSPLLLSADDGALSRDDMTTSSNDDNNDRENDGAHTRCAARGGRAPKAGTRRFGGTAGVRPRTQPMTKAARARSTRAHTAPKCVRTRMVRSDSPSSSRAAASTTRAAQGKAKHEASRAACLLLLAAQCVWRVRSPPVPCCPPSPSFAASLAASLAELPLLL